LIKEKLTNGGVPQELNQRHWVNLPVVTKN